MLCPVCDSVNLREIEKHNILIDTCPSCKGVWLDRGELDKIINELQDDSYVEPQVESRREQKPYYKEDYPQKSSDYYKHPKHKKKNKVVDIIGDLFG
ncbi:hypothetical protein HNQ94_003422 [Salirhabdus euzebyi]|uniref:Transcription factor zinc-finger domain-containing protein n=1 Tax=Salirhabdus euzebyi TaxID=394506 RepID=A0A841Q9F3_9BACI|nr:zf-TFIIB domain-containing protein [Salirhabdus euzebyi]MBB6454933.1 hypothetical protein [Salirhabdus euzebyi]